MANSMWTPDLQLRIWAFAKVFLQSLKDTVVWNVFVCYKIPFIVTKGPNLFQHDVHKERAIKTWFVKELSGLPKAVFQP